MRQRGQSMVETMLLVPIIMVLALGGLQMLWLFFAYQLVQATAVHVVRQASLDGMQRLRMYEVVEKRMRPMPVRVVHLPLVRRVHPTDEQIRRFGEPVIVSGQHYDELATDFAASRLSALPADERELWLRARTLQIELVWCQPLQVPIANQLLAYYLRYSLDIDQQYCNTQAIRRMPMMAVKAKAAAQLQAPLRIARR